MHLVILGSTLIVALLVGGTYALQSKHTKKDLASPPGNVQPVVTSLPKPQSPIVNSPNKTPAKPPVTAKIPAIQPKTADTPGICYQINGSSSRNTSDLPDDTSDYQLHVIYALPSDGVDHNYDMNGAIATSTSAWENWLCKQSGGKKFRLDSKNGALDVTFVRFSASDNTIKTGSDLPWQTNPNHNPYIRDDIEIYLKALGFNDPKKLYAVYYDGTSNYSCGGGAWPPTVAGHVSAEYMHGGGPGYPVACESNKLATSIQSPGYSDFDILHETMHTLGIAPTCAPHHVLSGHVSDSSKDLMYSGDQPWDIAGGLILDVNHDDYYNTGKTDCIDLAKGAFLDGGGPALPPNW